MIQLNNIRYEVSSGSRRLVPKTASSKHRGSGHGRNIATRSRRLDFALSDVSLRFDNATITYLVGLNGVGKSTLLKIMAGIVPGASGVVSVDGVDPRKWEGPGRSLGVFLDTTASDMKQSGRHHLHWVASAKRLSWDEADDMIERVGLAAVADRPVRSYSLGMRQRLDLATALLGWPRNIIMDEPMNGLDLAGMLWLRSLMRDLAERGHCVVVASHHFADVERTADRVVLLEGGNIVTEGSVCDVVGNHASLEEAFIDAIPRALNHAVAVGHNGALAVGHHNVGRGSGLARQI
ncbi:ATP-binding cassette domain-containing protein [uncultured Corynebacterium sp.]|uniref:ABC transporter ATP-binding protein n=1 Tax=uncultured Corynebacterium sp. TaxID=159447 RepID=UPI0025CE6120|nr:ATP-binding cassette domain-containing protein [uncultured Corynebacterium sp.]